MRPRHQARVVEDTGGVSVTCGGAPVTRGRTCKGEALPEAVHGSACGVSGAASPLRGCGSSICGGAYFTTSGTNVTKVPTVTLGRG